MAKKIFITIVLALVLLMAFVSCAKDDDSASPNISTDVPLWVSPAPSDGFMYNLLPNGTYEISDIGSCADEHIVIPGEYQAKKVSRIAAGAFANTNIKSITFLSEIEEIVKDAFDMCFELEKVVVLAIEDWYKISFEDK